MLRLPSRQNSPLHQRHQHHQQPQRRQRRPAAAAFALLAALAGCTTAPPVQAPAPVETKPAQVAPKPLVIGHRGASALRPEHTLASYTKAIEDGADIVEPDLVMTRDGVLVARHENDITGTTNVAEVPGFADRKKIKVIDGERLTGWFTEDFTLAELKTLRARERIPQIRAANARYDDQFEIPTFAEVIALVARESRRTGRVIGIYPETKHPSYFRGINLPLEDAVLTAIKANPYTMRAPVYLQSFETGNLRLLRQRIGKSMPNVKLVQLISNGRGRPADWRLAGDSRTYADMMTPVGLLEVASYADGIGPERTNVLPRDSVGRMAAPSSLVRDAHAAGLLVHPYTLRPENTFLPRDLRSNAGDNARNPAGMLREAQALIAAGVDGFFTDDPALGRQAVDTAPR